MIGANVSENDAKVVNKWPISAVEPVGYDEAGGMYPFMTVIFMVPDVTSMPCCSLGRVQSRGAGTGIVE